MVGDVVVGDVASSHYSCYGRQGLWQVCGSGNAAGQCIAGILQDLGQRQPRNHIRGAKSALRQFLNSPTHMREE
jgi:hypothetical protein